MEIRSLPRQIFNELRLWRWTWVGVVIVVVMPLRYMSDERPDHALFALAVGVTLALVGRASDHRTD